MQNEPFTIRFATRGVADKLGESLLLLYQCGSGVSSSVIKFYCSAVHEYVRTLSGFNGYFSV